MNTFEFILSLIGILVVGIVVITYLDGRYEIGIFKDKEDKKNNKK